MKRCNNLSYRVTNTELDFIEDFCKKNNMKKTDMVIDGLYALGVFEGYNGEGEKKEEPKKAAPKKSEPKKEKKDKKDAGKTKTDTKEKPIKKAEPKKAAPAKKKTAPKKKVTEKQIDKVLKNIKEITEKTVIIQLGKDGEPLATFKGKKHLENSNFKVNEILKVVGDKTKKYAGSKWIYG